MTWYKIIEKKKKKEVKKLYEETRNEDRSEKKRERMKCMTNSTKKSSDRKIGTNFFRRN